MRTEDGYIINQCLNGSTEAFGLLVDKYKESVYALAYAKLRNFHDAEDITQEVFIKAFQKLRTLKRWDNFLAWVFSITANLCKDFLRARTSRPDREYAEEQDADVLERPSMDAYREEQVSSLLHDALAELPETYCQVLTLYYLGGMSTKEIARFLGTPHDTVRQRLSRARSKLKKEILTMMTTTFEGHRLQPGFTFRIVEMIKDTKIHPIPRTGTVPLGFSITAGLIAIFLSLTVPDSPLYPIGELIGSALPSKTQVATVGAIPVDTIEVTEITILSSESGEGDFGQRPKPTDPVKAFGVGKWTQKKDLPKPRSLSASAEVDGKIYVIGGRQTLFRDAVPLSTVKIYDPDTNIWTQGAKMPTARIGLGLGVVNGKIYAIGGALKSNGRETVDAVEEYDPVADAWTKKADMPTLRWLFGTGVVNGKIYAIGGWDGGKILATVEEYDPAADKWTPKADMPTPRWVVGAGVVNEKIYVIGGAAGGLPDPGLELSTVEEYDPATDIWTKKADMPTARAALSASVVDGMIYAIGGSPTGNPVLLSTVEGYAPARDAWIKGTDMPTPRILLTTSAAKGKIYAIGGDGEPPKLPPLSTVEEFDPARSVDSEGRLRTMWGEMKAAYLK